MARGAFRNALGIPYTWTVMRMPTATPQVTRCCEEERSLALSCAAKSEVQIGGITKMSSWEVASTP
jgi:hypothetical protein